MENEGQILLVDDEPLVRGVLADMLRAAGFPVIEAGECGEALRLLDSVPPGAISLLVTDVMLLGPNGCELALQFLGREPKGRVLFISGYSGAEICQKYNVNVSDGQFLVKPIYPRVLVERVKAILQEDEGSLREWASGRLDDADGAPEHRPCRD